MGKTGVENKRKSSYMFKDNTFAFIGKWQKMLSGPCKQSVQ
jgi:hypothetical protein